jgi:multiple sugar transport system permease protein
VALPFLLPWLVGMLALIVIPIGLAVYWSFTDYNLLQAPNLIGLTNYSNLAVDPTFWQSVWNTIYILVLGVPIGIVIGLGIAMLLSQPIRGRGLHRSAIYLPAIVPPVAGAIMFLWIFNPNYGLLNAALGIVGIHGIGWLVDPSTAKIAQLVIVLWGTVGSTMVVFIAGLKEIPEQLYEAAAIDGATTWTRFRYITLPMLGPVLFYSIVVGVIFYLQFFEQAFVMTSRDLGAPVNSTLYFSLYLYQNAFLYLKMGYASAMACILFVATLAVTTVFFTLQKRLVYYPGEK